jgi:FlaA1/EpsC-like NDP-sugar epimerase
MTVLSERARAGLNGSLPAESIPVPGHVIAGKRILITGAGGSIGSALAHAVAANNPAKILLLDADEQALYQIDRALDAPHTPILASIGDAPALEETFERHHPKIVFHAAAFKHVALMEHHPFAALENNAVGTFLLAQAAIRHRAEQVVIVSTDKAADPAGIMGASKRVAELVALALATPATKIKAVRLGNVHGSRGSVVPLFEEQIERGEPVTITHPEATRYFLSLERAAALLLLALPEELSGAILIPELEDPVRIEDIAKKLIEERGSRSPIVHIGLRPGEKLHERLFSSEESLLGEPGAPLRVVQSKTISAEEAAVAVGELREAIRARSLGGLLRAVTRMIPAYQPSEAVLAQASAECRA